MVPRRATHGARPRRQCPFSSQQRSGWRVTLRPLYLLPLPITTQRLEPAPAAMHVTAQLST